MPVTFYPRVINKIDTDFSNEELSLLIRGLIHNWNTKKNDSVTNLTLEVKTPTTYSSKSDSEYYSLEAAKRL